MSEHDYAMDDEDIMRDLQERGLEMDPGYLIAGPFIPDGTVRIYDPAEPSNILGSGQTLAEAYEDLRSMI